MKALKIIAIGGAVFLGGRYLFSLNRAGKKIVVQVGGRVNKVSLNGVEVILKYNIQNPTRSSIRMSAPLIKLTYQGKVLASSSMSLVEIPEDVRSTNGKIKIEPFRETGFISTSILIPHLSLIGTGANLLTRLKDKLLTQSDEDPITFEIETTSTVFTKVGSYPYDEIEKITI